MNAQAPTSLHCNVATEAARNTAGQPTQNASKIPWTPVESLQDNLEKIIKFWDSTSWFCPEGTFLQGVAGLL